MKFNKKIPVTLFEKLEDFVADDDTRFTKVKIWLMHLDENYNGSFFSKKAVEKAIPTLKNTPILGYIEVNKSGEADFTNHRLVLEKVDGELKIKYEGRAFGTIPESNNAQFEKRIGTDGVEREYLTVEGLLWNKWDDATDIFERDQSKGQSMELHEDAKGFFDKKTKLFNFTDFKFFGACILGEDVKSAMNNATVELTFSGNDFSDYIAEQMEHFKVAYSQYQLSQGININKEGDEMKDKLLKIALKFSLNEEQLIEKGIDLTTFTSEKDFEAKLTELAKTFSMTSDQMVLEFRNQLRAKFSEKDDYGYKYKSYDYYFVDYEDGQIFAQSYVDGNRIVGFSYSMSGDVPVINFDSKKVKKIVYADLETGVSLDSPVLYTTKEAVEIELTVKEKEVEKLFSDKVLEKETEVQNITTQFEETKTELDQVKLEFEKVKTNFTELTSEIEPLRSFKVNADKESKEVAMNELFTKFSQLTEEEVADLKEKMFESTVEETEKELTYRLGKKVAEGKFNFTATPPNNNDDKGDKPIKVKLDGVEYDVTSIKDEKSYAHLFTKHLGQ